MKLGPVFSFTTEKILNIYTHRGPSFFFLLQFTSNIQILENDTLGPRTKLPAHRLLGTLPMAYLAHGAGNVTQDLWKANIFEEWQLKARAIRSGMKCLCVGNEISPFINDRSTKYLL